MAKDEGLGLVRKAQFALEHGTLRDAGSASRKMIENAYDRAVALQTSAKAKGLSEPKKSPKRGGYRVCVRTVRNGWATWTKDKATGLSGPDADRLMRKLNRAGYQVAKFQGRMKVK